MDDAFAALWPNGPDCGGELLFRLNPICQGFSLVVMDCFDHRFGLQYGERSSVLCLFEGSKIRIDEGRMAHEKRDDTNNFNCNDYGCGKRSYFMVR